MPDFSRSPQQELLTNLQKGYVGVHVEQGVPVLDRDLNLLNDLVSSTVRAIVSRYIGNGTAAGAQGFAIQAIPAANDFRIATGVPAPGTCLVGGIEVTIAADIDYSAQADVPALTTPDATQPNPRTDIVFLDAWLEDVDGVEDGDLLNVGDIGMQTSVRQRAAWRVRVAEGVAVPPPAPGHSHYPLAQIQRPMNEPQIAAATITDLRQTITVLAQVEDRLARLEQLIVLPAFDSPPDEFAPNLGGAGTNVTLSGRNFNIGTPQVLFGTTAALIVGTPTAEQIVAQVPSGLSGPMKITVVTDGGTAVTVEDFFVIASAPPGDAPVFAAPPNEFAPKLGGFNTAVTLFGDNFDEPGLQVAFGAVNAIIDSVNTGVTPMRIIARVPAGVSGAVTISITNNFGTATSVDSFTAL